MIIDRIKYTDERIEGLYTIHNKIHEYINSNTSPTSVKDTILILKELNIDCKIIDITDIYINKEFRGLGIATDHILNICNQNKDYVIIVTGGETC